jgi:hypothetical protein
MSGSLPPGTTVELVSSLPGYEAGTRGVIVRTSAVDTTVLVRFADTGHALYVSPDDLRIADAETTG